MEPLHVAIVMATYNGAAYLEEQLQSLVEQMRRPDGLLVSDDGSSDATWDLLQSFAADAPFPVRLIQHEQRLGAQQNFARSLEQAEGDRCRATGSTAPRSPASRRVPASSRRSGGAGYTTGRLWIGTSTGCASCNSI